VGEEQVSVQLDTQENCDVLELNITLPEDKETKAGKRSNGRDKSVKPVRNAGSLPAARDKFSEKEKKSKSQKKVT